MMIIKQGPSSTGCYGRVISAEEAVEILMNVRRLAEVILKVKKRRSGL